MTLDLTLDELLTTTRAVRKRLDLDRPVERHVLEECIEIGMQAPSARPACSGITMAGTSWKCWRR